MPKHHIIYVSGLGDPNRLESLVVRWWKLYNVGSHYAPPMWEDGEIYQPKFDRLIKLIDELNRQNKYVSLVGTSAGASAVLNAYANGPEKINGVVCICGKIQNLQAIGDYYFNRSLAFKQSVARLPASLKALSVIERHRIMSIRPLKDNVVPPADTVIDGAKLKVIPTFGHAFSIAFALTFGSWSIVKFLKSVSR